MHTDTETITFEQAAALTRLTERGTFGGRIFRENETFEATT